MLGLGAAPSPPSPPSAAAFVSWRVEGTTRRGSWDFQVTHCCKCPFQKGGKGVLATFYNLSPVEVAATDDKIFLSPSGLESVKPC